MDNAQVTARDGSWFLFADWQGITRLVLPGDKVKTDAKLDRPHENKPLVLRPNGLVWSEYAVDIDPVSLKKLRQDDPTHDSPDPLGGPDIAVDYSGEEVSIGGVTLSLAAHGDEIRLGGRERSRGRASTAYDLFPDASVVILGMAENTMHAGLVLRGEDGSARVAWCRPIALVLHGAPDVFRQGASTFLADRDPVAGVAYLAQIDDDGSVALEASTNAVAGPWVLDGQVWWQPDEETVCAGPQLGEVAETFTLPEAHRGPGRLLRLAGRKLFLAWHGVTLLDFAPAKKGKSELSRKHKAAEEPMYREAARLLRPLAEGMAGRGVRVTWRGCVRRGKRLELKAQIAGRANILTYLLGRALQNGGRAKLASVGVSSVSYYGGGSFDDILSAPLTTADDIREFVTMLDEVGISRAAAIPDLQTLWRIAAERELPLPITPEAEDLALAAVLSGLRGETSGPIPPVTADAFAAVTPMLRDFSACHAAGIDNSTTAMFITVAGHRRFGAEAVASTLEILVAMNSTYGDEVAKALGQPVAPHVPPVVTEPELDAREAELVAELEAALSNLGVDPEASRESLRWYRFSIDDAPFQAGLHDDFRVSATLCATETDANMRALSTSLAAANKRISGARLFEADCYIHVGAACPFAEASAAKITTMLQACRDALASDAAQKLRASYRSFD